MRTQNRAIPPGRGGFTLIELLVAIGLTLFIMTIIVEAFSISMDAYSGFRAVGDIQNQSRAALLMLKNDLSNVRFEGGRKMSDQNFWDAKVKEGFFSIKQGAVPVPAPGIGASYVDEGVDLDGVHHAYRATDHVLHFGMRMRENRRDQVFTAPNTAAGATAMSGRQIYTTNLNPESVFGGTATTPIGTQWAEVGYYLVPKYDLAGNPVTINDPNPTAFGKIPLYNLYRMQLMVLPMTDKVNGQIAYDPNIARTFSGSPVTDAGKFKFYSPNDLAAGAGSRGFRPTAINPTVDVPRSSLICTNVVSFQVRIMKDKSLLPNAAFEDPPQSKAAAGTAIFDTSAGDPGFRVIGAQVTLRVFDPSSGLTRQTTLVQDF